MIQDSIFVLSTHRAPYEINILFTVGLFCFITDDIWFSLIHKRLQLNSIAFRGNIHILILPLYRLGRMHVIMSRGGNCMSMVAENCQYFFSYFLLGNCL